MYQNQSILTKTNDVKNAVFFTPDDDLFVTDGRCDEAAETNNRSASPPTFVT
ncbi:MAG: hypothetical protein LBT83_02155 [Tannerella sp.]|nr:hypothetical protein [Tannerella sp.]